MEQGIPLQPNLLTFNRFKFFASKGVKLGPTVLSSWWVLQGFYHCSYEIYKPDRTGRFSDLIQIYTIFQILSGRLSGGSIVGSIAPHQAFAIGGPNSVRGYGEGAVGSGQSYLASKTELAIPLVYIIMLIIPYLAWYW